MILDMDGKLDFHFQLKESIPALLGDMDTPPCTIMVGGVPTIRLNTHVMLPEGVFQFPYLHEIEWMGIRFLVTGYTPLVSEANISGIGTAAQAAPDEARRQFWAGRSVWSVTLEGMFEVAH